MVRDRGDPSGQGLWTTGIVDNRDCGHLVDRDCGLADRKCGYPSGQRRWSSNWSDIAEILAVRDCGLAVRDYGDPSGQRLWTF